MFIITPTSLIIHKVPSAHPTPRRFLSHHHISVMELGHLLTRSGLTYPEVSSKVCHDSFCQFSLRHTICLPARLLPLWSSYEFLLGWSYNYLKKLCFGFLDLGYLEIFWTSTTLGCVFRVKAVGETRNIWSQLTAQILQFIDSIKLVRRTEQSVIVTHIIICCIRSNTGTVRKNVTFRCVRVTIVVVEEQ